MAQLTFDGPSPQDDVLPPFPVRRWSVQEYLRLAAEGFLDEDDNLELLEGWIVRKMTKNPRHDATVDRIGLRLAPVIPDGWYVRTQNVLTTPDSAPEPDVVIVRGQPDDYLERHPSAGDVALVIEVADSSLTRERPKAAICARAVVPAYWVANLVESVLEIYGDPKNGVYRSRQVLSRSETVLLTFPTGPSLSISVADLVP